MEKGIKPLVWRDELPLGLLPVIIGLIAAWTLQISNISSPY